MDLNFLDPKFFWTQNSFGPKICWCKSFFAKSLKRLYYRLKQLHWRCRIKPSQAEHFKHKSCFFSENKTLSKSLIKSLSLSSFFYCFPYIIHKFVLYEAFPITNGQNSNSFTIINGCGWVLWLDEFQIRLNLKSVQ